MLVLGATSMVFRAPQWNSVAGAWLRGVLQRRPARLATVALANKMARIAWAVMTRGQVYPFGWARGGSRGVIGWWSRLPCVTRHGIRWSRIKVPAAVAEPRDGKTVVKTVRAIPFMSVCLEHVRLIGARHVANPMMASDHMSHKKGRTYGCN